MKRLNLPWGKPALADAAGKGRKWIGLRFRGETPNRARFGAMLPKN